MAVRRPAEPGIPPLTVTCFAHSIEATVGKHPDLPGQRLAQLLWRVEGGAILLFMPLEALAPTIRALEDIQRHANTGLEVPRGDGRPAA